MYLFWNYDAVSSGMSVQEHSGNEKSCLWHATDFSDGELKDELFCIRLASIESKFICENPRLSHSPYTCFLNIESNVGTFSSFRDLICDS